MNRVIELLKRYRKEYERVPSRRIELDQAIALLKQQPEPGKFTKNLRYIYNSFVKAVPIWMRDFCPAPIRTVLDKTLEACNLIDCLAAKIEELKQQPKHCETCDGYGKINKHNYSTGRMEAIPCETCGGSGEVPNPQNYGAGNKWDCPDCKPEPSEFVKDIRAIILKRSRNSVDRRELDDNKILLACDIIDRQAEEIKELKQQPEPSAFKCSCPDPDGCDIFKKYAKACNTIDRQANETKPLKEIINDLESDEECSFDHHGYCQTHCWFYIDRPCPQKRIKALTNFEREEK